MSTVITSLLPFLLLFLAGEERPDLTKLSREQLLKSYIILEKENTQLREENARLKLELEAIKAVVREKIVADAPVETRFEKGGEGWTLAEETTIKGKISGSVKKGYIFKTTSGSMYELIDYVYLYEYEYQPDVTVLKNGQVYRLLIEGIDEQLHCKALVPPGARAKTGNLVPATGSSVVTESTIESDFDGLDFGNIYKLRNGEIYEQTEAYIWIHIAVFPQVTIWRDGVDYKMKVAGIGHPVAVRRIK